MRVKGKGVLVALAVVAAVGFLARLALACGPFYPEYIFVNTVHPDLPIGDFAIGNLGVVQPGFRSIYLYAAYRNLADAPFDAHAQAVFWDQEGGFLTSGGETVSATTGGQQNHGAGTQPNWEEQWFSAVGQKPPEVPTRVAYGFNYSASEGIYREVASHEYGTVLYSSFLNCPQDAFHTALVTLQARRQQFGETSSVVQDWVGAQGEVFGNCMGQGAIPDPLPASAPGVARADRAYQIAAAHFYAGDYEQAADGFRAIAQDSSSPWSAIAPYLVARALVRQATVNENAGANHATLAKAEAQAQSVLADPRLGQYHSAAEKLLGFIEFRLHPRERMVQLAKNLSQSKDPNLHQDIVDFTLLFNHFESYGAYQNPQPIQGDVYSQLADVRGQNDLLDWMLTMRLNGPDAYNHAFEKWQTTHSEAWLVAAATKAEPDSAHLPELLAAAGIESKQSTAYVSVTFQSLRVLLQEHKDEEVRQRLARLRIGHLGPFYEGAETPRSAQNLFLAMRFELARNPEELFENAPRIPATITDDSQQWEMPAYPADWGQPAGSPALTTPQLDDDGLVAFNRFLPVTMLAKATESPKLPENLRREIALVAWTRAALLGDADVARALSQVVQVFHPELKTSLGEYDSAATPEARNFAAALTMLQFPGLRPFITTPARGTAINEIDSLRDNWWGTVGPICAPLNSQNAPNPNVPAPQWPIVRPALQVIYPGGKIGSPEFLSAEERRQAADEWKRLGEIGPGPDYLTAQVIAWGKAHGDDARVPEGLALAVRATRYGCVDEKTGQLSKAAFDLLHAKYPDSDWAKKTKYWFK